MAEFRAILDDEAKLDQITRGVFESIDTNQSGSIDKKELKAALNQIAQEAGSTPPTDSEIDSAMAAIDTDHSGTVEINEFKELIRSILQALVNS